MLLLIIISLVSICYLWNRTVDSIMKKNTIWKELDGQTIVITGATSGIGRFTLLKIFEHCSSARKVVFTGLNFDRAISVIQALVALATEKRAKAADSKEEKRWSIVLENLNAGKWEGQQKFVSEQVVFYRVELSDLDEVNSFAKYLKTTVEKIDVLINNAGGLITSHKKSKQNLEYVMSTNYYGHFVLIDNVLELLENSPTARIINYSSCMHLWVPPLFKAPEIDFEDVDRDNKPFDFWMQYGCSKLSVVLGTKAWQQYFDKNRINIKCVAVHPGVALSNFTRDFPFYLRMFADYAPFLGPIFMNTLEQ